MFFFRYYSKPTPTFLGPILVVGYLYDVCSGYSKPTPKFLRYFKDTPEGLRSIQLRFDSVLGVG